MRLIYPEKFRTEKFKECYEYRKSFSDELVDDAPEELKQLWKEFMEWQDEQYRLEGCYYF